MTRFPARQNGWSVPPAAWAAAAYGLMAVAMFWRLWAPNVADRLTIGAADGDFQRQFHPYREFVARSWSSLRPPLWNPHQYAGTPAWADPQLAVVYPWRIVDALVALARRPLPLGAVEFEAVVHLVVAALTAYALARALGLGPMPGFVAGLVYGFGGYATGYPMEQLAVLESAAWIPAMLAAWARGLAAVDEGRPRAARRWSLVGAGAAALSVLAGHPQTVLYAGYLAVAWWVVRVATAKPERRAGYLRSLALVAVAAAGLSAIAWLPTVALTPQIARDLSTADLGAGLTVSDLAQILLPHAGGRWWPLWVGAVPLALAVLSAPRVARARFWLAVAGVGVLLALGRHGPLLAIALRVAPGFALFRHHERAAVVVALGLAMAAAHGMQAVAGRPDDRRRLGRSCLVVAAVSAVAAVGLSFRGAGLADDAVWAALSLSVAGSALAAPGLDDRASGLLLCAAVAVPLAAVNAGTSLMPATAATGPATISPATTNAAATGPATANAATTGLGTADPATGNAAATGSATASLPAGIDTGMPGRVSSEGLVAPGANAASLLGFHDVTGDSPFHLGEIDRLMERSPELVWWRLLNVTSVVTRRTFPAGAPVEPVAGGATATDDATNRGAAVYRVLVPAPFVWVPERVETLPPEWRPGPNFDPRKLGLVPGDTGAPDSGPAGSATMPGADALDGSAAPASLEGFGRFRIVVDATLPRQGIVVVSSAYAPGWRAQAVAADGTRSTPRVEPAYGALMAVALPPGQWRIRWTYLPGSVILGAVVTLLTLIAGAALWIRPRNPGR